MLTYKLAIKELSISLNIFEVGILNAPDWTLRTEILLIFVLACCGRREGVWFVLKFCEIACLHWCFFYLLYSIHSHIITYYSIIIYYIYYYYLLYAYASITEYVWMFLCQCSIGIKRKCQSITTKKPNTNKTNTKSVASQSLVICESQHSDGIPYVQFNLCILNTVFTQC